ncbi:MAG: hypothetical protein CME62_15955 [Halobacteriovoraceae bacterium]|nr:hypothetical protein [Halobacteriovoraceae bacterium]|tara:strand:+ start:9694 stop:10962 length:1269 start_codon:yes stop_codon:yes gene_type:complete
MKNFLRFFKNFTQEITDLDPESKKVTFYLFLTYFFVLFSYPLVRSSTGAIFYEVYSSEQYSLATFIGVLALMGMISFNNKLQAKLGVHKLFVFTGFLTILMLMGSYSMLLEGTKEMAFVLFATKEAYIVLLVHTTLAFANAFYPLGLFKKLIGPIGAAGSLGGIIGGQLTTYLAKSSDFGTEYVFYLALVFIFITVVIFYQTHNVDVKGLGTNKSITPLKTIRGVKKYVGLIAAIVALSQFVIFIADLQFNLIFEQVVTEKNARTAYLGNFYSLINLVSLVLQLIILPYVLIKISLRSIFLFIPLLYLILVIGGLGFGASQLVVVGFVFIAMKGTDYSVFAVVKEVMYHPLLSLQKFGAKYITDMFVYRLSKATIAFIFAQLAITEIPHIMKYLSVVQFVFLALWVLLIVKLFQEQKKLNHS